MRQGRTIPSLVFICLLTLIILPALQLPSSKILDVKVSPVPNSSATAGWLQSAQNLGLSFQSMDTIYHRILALDYLGGLNQLSASNRTLLINYIANTYNGTAGGYGNWPRSAPSIESTYHAIQTLNALNSLPTSNAAPIAQFISSLQQSDGGFKALAASTSSDVGSTYRAIHTLLILRGNTNDINLTSALTFLTNSQNGDGGFGQAPGNTSQLVYTFRAVYAYDLAGNTPPNLSNIVTFVKNLRQSDNGWADIAGGLTSVGHTYDAVHTLDIINQIQPGTLDSTTASRATSFTTQSQIPLSGFGSSPRDRTAEFISTHFAAQALQLLQPYTTVTYDINSARQFSLAGPAPDGGFAGIPGGTTNLPDTYYAVLALHMLSSTPTDSNLALAFAKNSYSTVEGGFGFRPAAGALVRNTYFGIQTLRFYGAQRIWTQVVSFLQNSQNPDGGFGASPGNVSTVESTSYAALSLQKLSSEPTDKAGAIGYLLNAQNGDGGFGVQPSAASNAESTMRAILGLNALGHPLSSVSNALTYIASTRNPDGGYAFRPGNTSRTDHTLEALLTYGAFRSSMPNNSTTRSFILSLQNADGGFALRSGATSEVRPTYEATEFLTLFDLIAGGAWSTDLYGPVIVRTLAPAIALPGMIPLRARVTDPETGVANVTLSYSTDAVNFQSQTLTSNSGNNYEWNIGPYSDGTLITYRISAYDNAGNLGSTQLHTVRVQTFGAPIFQPNTLILLLLLIALAASLAAFTPRRRHR